MTNQNALGQRTNVEQTGTAFSSSRDIAWAYDALGQVISADSSIPAHNRAYQYDAIGNRLFSEISNTQISDPATANTTAYTANALNQYTAIDSLNPAYDDDGNMTSGPLPADPGSNSTLTWDAENRLISATVNSVTTTYLYDAQSRRIATITGGNTTVFVYDSWNPVAEYSHSALVTPNSALTKSYTWSTDLSGTLQGAGGVGGLLMVSEIENSQISNHYPTFDGNGNISEYLDETGAVAAHYEYDPFGRTVIATGAKANDFAHRFSTKLLDATTGLYYYGYRFYDPLTGRWPSRDPIEEEGGLNLYGFVGNNGTGKFDVNGQFAFCLPLVVPLAKVLIDIAVTGMVVIATYKVVEQVVENVEEDGQCCPGRSYTQSRVEVENGEVDCGAVKRWCIEMCEPPTPWWDNAGDAFYKCVADCMANSGC